MSTKYRVLFLILAAVFILSTFFKPYPASWAIKLLPIILLVISTWSVAATKSQYLFLIGLVFSGMGDFFLDYDRVNWFIFGLGAFLIAHVFYISALLPIRRQQIPFVILYLVGGISVFLLIHQYLGELMIPVVIYMCVLLFMGMSTLMSKQSNRWLIIGGACFVLSDALLAIDKFYHPIPLSTVLIMLTYYTAQFFLTNGVLRFSVEKQK